MPKSIPWYLGISGKNPALGPPKSALGQDFFQNPSDRGWIFYQKYRPPRLMRHRLE